MRALIDAHMLGAHETGNETYMRGLLQGLAEIGSRQAVAVARSVTESIAAPAADASAAHVGAANPSVAVRGHDMYPLPHRSNSARLLRDLPAMARAVGASLIHCTYVAPPFSPVPTVLTVHDVSFARYPEAFTLRDRALLGTAVPFSARRAAAIIVPSEHARGEVIEVLRVPAERVHVTLEACGAEFAPVTAEARRDDLSGYGIDGPYVLAVGNLQPRKNLARLLAAWRLLRDSGGLLGCRLVLVGGYHGKREPLAELVEALGLGRDVLLTGYVAQEHLPALYSGARAFVYPSLYEGFGLPVLEAMACGTPVACSRAASLPEVAGEAAAMFDPHDEEAIAATLGALIADDALCAALTKRGAAQARSFSWRACAARTLEVYEAV